MALTSAWYTQPNALRREEDPLRDALTARGYVVENAQRFEEQGLLLYQCRLPRETREETGLDIIPDSIRPFGVTREIRASQFVDKVIFDHTSYYYFADVTDGVHGEEYRNCLPAAAANAGRSVLEYLEKMQV
jgi:ADP-ribose pyrophosphatase YjhB (NUDIX family)